MGQIRLKTNSQKKPIIELTVIGLVQKEITAAPQYLYFGVIDTSIKSSDPKRLTRTVQISRARGNAFTIEKVESNPDHIKTEVVPGHERGKLFSGDYASLRITCKRGY